jgi:DNA-binding Lrp family transcriptional regulator
MRVIVDHESQAPALTELEGAITAHLQRDGRIPFRTLAAHLGVTETTVYRRAQHLMDNGYFQVIGVVDPLRSGHGHAVLAGIHCDPPAVHDLATALAAIPEVRFAALVTGTFDVVCEMVTADHAAMVHLLTRVLPTIPGVRSLNTSWVLHNYITHFLWDLQLPLLDPAWDEQARSSPARMHAAATAVPQEGTEPAPAPEIVLDGTDQEIVALLQQHGRISYAEIATTLGLTESTARRRTIRILQSGHVQVVAVSNPFMLGFQDVVLIWFKLDLSHLASVVAALRDQPAIRYLSRTAGGVDLVAEALFRSHAALYAFLNGPLAAIQGIRDVSISVELLLIKRAYRRFDRPEDRSGCARQSMTGNATQLQVPGETP